MRMSGILHEVLDLAGPGRTLAAGAVQTGHGPREGSNPPAVRQSTPPPSARYRGHGHMEGWCVMSLPDRPNLEYLKKLAKDRLRDLRRGRPAVRLAEAQLAVA